MNIVDFLIEDHHRMRREMAGIHRAMNCEDLRERVRSLIMSYELHEAIEEEILFPAFEAALRRSRRSRAPDPERMHEAMWARMDELMLHLNRQHHVGLLQAFFDFSAAAEKHFEAEERNLFPVVREAMDEESLMELGERAQRKLDRFSGAAAAHR